MSSSNVVFITGANTGLGLETVKSLCRSSNKYSIIVGSRSVTKGEEAVTKVKEEYPSTSSVLDVVQVDIASDESIEQAIETITSKYGRLDVLVNNAGAAFDNQIKPKGNLGIREGFNKSWDTNVSGTQVLTTLAIPLLLKSSDPRLIFITSGTSTLTETELTNTVALKHLNSSPAAGWPKPPQLNETMSYRSTKTGLNMIMREWTRILGNDGVKVWAVSPGFLKTALSGLSEEQLTKMGAIPPSEGGDTVVETIEGKQDQNVGKAIRRTNVQPW